MPSIVSPEFRSAFEGDAAITKYGDNALLMFALDLYLRPEDLEEFASDSLTDGPGDKKIDVCYVNTNDGRAIIAQGYMSKNWNREAGPSNKAADLHTAISWLLNTDISKVPNNLKDKAQELRQAVIRGEVSRLEIIFVSNCPSSQNVKQELKSVEDATKSMLVAMNATEVMVSSHEFGLAEINDLYVTRDRTILVDDRIEIPCEGLFEEKGGDDWDAVATTVTGTWIRDLYKQHGDKLFSANFRDWLGLTMREGNINKGIKETATNEPNNFWVFNNGITALTNKIQIEDGVLCIHGLSIINGAQTTGSVGDAEAGNLDNVKVMFRAVSCTSPDLIDKIVRYNNTQNIIRSSDLRSNDNIQKRLREEFARYGIAYIHRRSKYKKPVHGVTFSEITPWLCAFQGDPQLASRNANDIFLKDEDYNKVFPREIAVEHVYLVVTLASAIDKIKYDLKSKVSASSATELEISEYEALKWSASKHFVLFVVGKVAEQLMKKRLSNIVNWQCDPSVVKTDWAEMVAVWTTVLHAVLPLLANAVATTKQSGYDVSRSSQLSKSVCDTLSALLASLEVPLGGQFSQLRTVTSF